MAEASARSLEALLLHREIEEFLYAEADLLDARRFEDWLALLTEDVRYWMPLARNVRYDQSALEYTREQHDAAWFDEGKETLTQRVQQIKTGVHWAEEPRSRSSHFVTNIRILEATPDWVAPQEVLVKCRFLVYRNRVSVETDVLAGKRHDRLRRNGNTWLISRREIHLDQTVLQAKNLSTFL
jgi:3-phenylpropionate/cinnamic acid dioxygenase small subunit